MRNPARRRRGSPRPPARAGASRSQSPVSSSSFRSEASMWIPMTRSSSPAVLTIWSPTHWIQDQCPSLCFIRNSTAKGRVAHLQLSPGLVRRRGGVLGMEEAQPGVVGVGELGIGVAEHPLPCRGIEDASRLQVEVEEPDGALLREELQGLDLVVGVCRGRKARPERRLDRDDVAAPVPIGLLRAHRHRARCALPGLDREDRALVEHRREQDVPLGLDHLGLVGDDIEREQSREEFADQFPSARLPERLRLLVGGGHLSRAVQHQDRHPGRVKARIGYC